MVKKSDKRFMTIGRNHTQGLECTPAEVEFRGEARCGRGGIKGAMLDVGAEWWNTKGPTWEKMVSGRHVNSRIHLVF